jgi:putative ribosome biogenesis GTPase RsgA
MKTIHDWALEHAPKETERTSYGRELLLTFSNRKSLFSSKKIERFIVFWVFLAITVAYLVRKMDTIDTLGFIEIVGLWLTYGGYNTYISHRENKQAPVEEINS